jgi:zinc transporter ZupT
MFCCGADRCPGTLLPAVGTPGEETEKICNGRSFMETEGVLTVFIAALITAICTGLGALPFFFFKEIGKFWLGVSNALAAGLMLGASLGLVREGINYDILRVGIGFVLGFVLIVIARHVISDHDEDIHLGAVQGASAAQMLLIVGVMTVHSFAEGVSVGVSYGDSNTFGAFISFAIAIHNIPEGLAISLVLVPKGVSVWKAAGWSVFSSLPQPLMAVPAFLFVLVFRPFLPIGLGLAAGAMIYMVFSELLPDALEDVSKLTAAASMVLATFAMLAFQFAIG